jgi:hypothetical protein
MTPAWFKRLANLWPPFLGAGIRVSKISADFTEIDVELRMGRFNKNYVGTHFGGSIYAMTDPFYMMILIKNLGDDYVVWDKAAEIQFKKPGKGKLTAHFNITKERIAEIKAEADREYKTEPKFKVEIKNEHGEVVAEVNKTLYVRRKDRKPNKGNTPV